MYRESHERFFDVFGIAMGHSIQQAIDSLPFCYLLVLSIDT